ncbi:hypothetical protein SLA2020_185750 [Shorea laevis]
MPFCLHQASHKSPCLPHKQLQIQHYKYLPHSLLLDTFHCINYSIMVLNSDVGFRLDLDLSILSLMTRAIEIRRAERMLLLTQHRMLKWLKKAREQGHAP